MWIWDGGFVWKAPVGTPPDARNVPGFGVVYGAYILFFLIIGLGCRVCFGYYMCSGCAG